MRIHKKSSQDMPCRTALHHAKLSQAKPSRAEPSRAEPSQAKPSRAKPSHAMPCNVMSYIMEFCTAIYSAMRFHEMTCHLTRNRRRRKRRKRRKMGGGRGRRRTWRRWSLLRLPSLSPQSLPPWCQSTRERPASWQVPPWPSLGRMQRRGNPSCWRTGNENETKRSEPSIKPRLTGSRGQEYAVT